MKKIVFVGLAVLTSCFLLNSCDPWEDDSYHEGSGITSLVGTWKLTALTIAEPYDINGDGTSSTDLMAETACYANELMSFSANQTGVVDSNSYAEITITPEGFSSECITEADPSPFTWVQNQNMVAITSDGTTFNATITGNTLTFTIINGFYAYEEGEDGEEIEKNLTFTFTKQ